MTRTRHLEGPPPGESISEAQFQHRVIGAARVYGWRVNHQRPALTRSGRWSTATQGDIGFPDLVLARGGQVLIVELKTNRGRVSPEQRKWLTELGDLARLWRPRDWDNILDELQAGPPPPSRTEGDHQ